MRYQAIKKVRLALGLTAVALAVGAVAAVGPAAAATQHWASASEVPFGNSQSFTGTGGGYQMKVTFSGIEAEIECNSLATSGTAENPAGGGAGTLSGVSYALTGCTTSVNNCQLKGNSIQFNTLKGTLREESGRNRLRLEPIAGTEIAHLNFEPRCPLGSVWYLTGYLEAGQYEGFYSLSDENMSLGGDKISTQGEFSLSAGGHPLAASSSGSPGKPRWYLSPKWTALPTATSTAIIDQDAFPFSLSTTVAGAPVTVTCGGGNFVAGSVENPAGGGAGTMNGLFTFESCGVTNKGCYSMSGQSQGELPGVATEVGGVPAVEWAFPTRTSLVVFHMNSGCSLGSTMTVTGKLIATYKGHGEYSLANSKLEVGKQAATVASNFVLETEVGAQLLGLQP